MSRVCCGFAAVNENGVAQGSTLGLEIGASTFGDLEDTLEALKGCVIHFLVFLWCFHLVGEASISATFSKSLKVKCRPSSNSSTCGKGERSAARAH